MHLPFQLGPVHCPGSGVRLWVGAVVSLSTEFLDPPRGLRFGEQQLCRARERLDQAHDLVGHGALQIGICRPAIDGTAWGLHVARGEVQVLGGGSRTIIEYWYQVNEFGTGPTIVEIP